MSKLEKIFSDLNKWRHFPKYQLERHAGIFFSIYLPEILEDCLKIKVKPHVIPEMPIFKEDNNQSTNVDYLLVGKDDDKDYVYLVELKTDISSLRKPQHEILEKLSKKNFSDLWKGLKEIVLATQKKKKYCHLLCALGETGLLDLDKEETFENYFYPDTGTQNKNALEAGLGPDKIKSVDLGIKIVYILPHPHRDDKELEFADIIYFKDIQRTLEEKFKDDEVAKLFAHCLSLWKEDAGLNKPSEVKIKDGYRQ